MKSTMYSIISATHAWKPHPTSPFASARKCPAARNSHRSLPLRFEIRKLPSTESNSSNAWNHSVHCYALLRKLPRAHSLFRALALSHHFTAENAKFLAYEKGWCFCTADTRESSTLDPFACTIWTILMQETIDSFQFRVNHWEACVTAIGAFSNQFDKNYIWKLNCYNTLEDSKFVGADKKTLWINRKVNAENEKKKNFFQLNFKQKSKRDFR